MLFLLFLPFLFFCKCLVLFGFKLEILVVVLVVCKKLGCINVQARVVVVEFLVHVWSSV